MSSFEVNFDGLVGPTHNYAGLSFGNVASSQHEGRTSSPREAALQGLEKMRSLQQLGLKQAVLPPQERPHLPTLERLGLSGATPAETLARAWQEAPELLAAAASASSMWVANAATISPFADSADGKTHLTPANLSSMFHRSIEVPTTSAVLKAIFAGENFCHHPALPAGQTFSDEGAANHTRFCNDYGQPGVEFFVYGVSQRSPESGPKRYPARQTLQACEAIARNHHLAPERTVFAQQNPAAIDAGVFHNDVIAVGNRQLLLYHELAFADTHTVRRQLDAAFGGDGLHYIEVPSSKVALEDAVATYLFNTQLVSPPGTDGTTIVAPIECAEHPAVNEFLMKLQADHPLIDSVQYFDLRQSMNNGGGPACLRLRVVMNQAQIAATQARVFLDDALYAELKRWIESHYRESLAPADLKDPALLQESYGALDELTRILRLGSVYDFQRA